VAGFICVAAELSVELCIEAVLIIISLAVSESHTVRPVIFLPILVISLLCHHETDLFS
jgi:hypothetical protein